MSADRSPGFRHLRTASARATAAVLLALVIGATRPAHAEARFDAPYQVFSTPRFSNSLAVGDVNGDERPDLMTAGPGTYSIHLGRSDGTFEPPQTDPGGERGVVGLADLNGDDILDAVTSDVSSAVARIGIGDGTFGAPVSFACGNEGDRRFGHLVDFDENGDLDLLPTGSTTALLLGNGDGTFAPWIAFPVSFAVAGDVDQDGHLDLATPISSGYQVRYGNGDGTFDAPVTIPITPPTNFQIGVCAISDVNGDGRNDLIVLMSNYVGISGSSQLSVGLFG